MLWPMLDGLRTLGADVGKVARQAGISLEALEDPDTRVPIERAIELSAFAARSIDDEALGLHLAEMYRPGAFGVLDYLAHSSRTLGEALHYLCRYNRLLQDAAETRLEVLSNRAVIWQRVFDGVWFPPGLVENSMANLIVIARRLTGNDVIPVEVRFRHPAPSYTAEHARIFKAPVRFDADRDGIVLESRHLELPLVDADPNLCSILDRHAKKLIGELPRVAQFSARVRELAAGDLKSGSVTAERIARKLQMSVRTLRRRLDHEGETYESLVEQLRRALTEGYMHDAKLSVEQIALLVGYSEASAFRRAFRRWHGTSPARYRRLPRMER